MSNISTAIRILLCEDQRLIRESLHIMLELEEGFFVVGEAANGNEAIEQVKILQPDIVLMDVQMPQLNGVEATAVISTQYPATKVIILTTFNNDDYVFEAMKAGAMGFLLKDVPAVDLRATIRRIFAGETFIEPSIATRLIREYNQQGHLSRDPARTHTSNEQLTERELEVLQLVARGASNREIADQLVLSEGTVKNHVSNILLKLQVANRTHAVAMAREQGLIQ